MLFNLLYHNRNFLLMAASMASKVKPAIVDTTPSPGVPRLSSVGFSTARLHTCGHMCRLRTLSRNRLYMFVCISPSGNMVLADNE